MKGHRAECNGVGIWILFALRPMGKVKDRNTVLGFGLKAFGVWIFRVYSR